MAVGTRTWRSHHPHKPNFGNAKPYPATWIFDNMAFIGDESVACFLVETDAGLLLIDAMFPEQRYLDMIETGIRELGCDPNDLKAVLITHGHFDHYGMADKLREKYGCRLYMSEIDFKRFRHETRPPHALDFDMDDFLTDGEDFTLGDTAIRCVWTPGHTEGCMSFIIPVYDEGRPHHLAIWGGTGIIPGCDKQAYLDSVEKFDRVCDLFEVDCEISNHPFVDNSILRMNVIRDIADGVPNPFVIGRDAYKRYEQMFYDMCKARMAAEAAKE